MAHLFVKGYNPWNDNRCKVCDHTKAHSNHNPHDVVAEYFKVGNVIFSDYGRSYDLVLDFHPAGLGVGWSVDVIECNADGIPTHGSWKRNHCTYPDKRDKVTAHVDTLDVIRTYAGGR